MISTHIQLHYHFLYDLFGAESMTWVVGRSIRLYRPVCVPMHAKVISSVQVPHSYLDVYDNI